jgi:hypothetical protein
MQPRRWMVALSVLCCTSQVVVQGWTCLGGCVTQQRIFIRRRRARRSGWEIISPLLLSRCCGNRLPCSSLLRLSAQSRYDDFADGNLDDEFETEADDETGRSKRLPLSLPSDWVEAELTLRSAPREPHPGLSPHQVATLCCRSLQWVDYPAENAGLERCYRFFTTECRKLVTGRQSDAGGKEESSMQSFCRYAALSPALQPFMGATRVAIGAATVTPARPPTRGALASFPVVVRGAPVLAVQHASGMARSGVASAPPTSHLVIRLEEQRRPPHRACWLVREVLDVRHAFAGDMGNAHVGG